MNLRSNRMQPCLAFKGNFYEKSACIQKPLASPSRLSTLPRQPANILVRYSNYSTENRDVGIGARPEPGASSLAQQSEEKGPTRIFRTILKEGPFNLHWHPLLLTGYLNVILAPRGLGNSSFEPISKRTDY